MLISLGVDDVSLLLGSESSASYSDEEEGDASIEVETNGVFLDFLVKRELLGVREANGSTSGSSLILRAGLGKSNGSWDNFFAEFSLK